MTTLTTPARREDIRPVRWRQLAWVSWRQYRISMIGAGAFLGVLALYLLLRGLTFLGTYNSYLACKPANSPGCAAALTVFQSTYSITVEVTGDLLNAVPVLVGVFAGAPILARELDNGTARFAWTQGAGRIRWTIARLALPALSVTAATAAFSQLYIWFNHPFFDTGFVSRFGPQYFNLTGVAFAAWTLAAFAIGAFAGVLIRRVVPAIAAAMAVWGGLMLATLLVLRQHYLAPLLTKGTGSVPNGAWVVAQWWTAPNGQVLSTRQVIQLLQTGPGPGGGIGIHRLNAGGNPFASLTKQGYTEWSRYQPASRYWPFQWIEGGWLLALSLVLIVATIWLVRRRAA
jgi:hypothetical protein